ncbi:hypothetical protein U1Q18_034501 [Sarracenia purpurea var. burkii]
MLVCQIIVWKLALSNQASLISPVQDRVNPISSFDESFQLHSQQYEAVHICRLVGHEGSIFRITWSFDGSKLISASDDRSARLWTVHAERKEFDNSAEILGSHTVGPVKPEMLFPWLTVGFWFLSCLQNRSIDKYDMRLSEYYIGL